MSAIGLDADFQPPQEADELHFWMEELACGHWSPDDFLNEVIALEKHDAGLPWEALTLLEEFFHRERISHEVFVVLRARLEKHLLDSNPPAPPLSMQIVLPRVKTSDAGGPRRIMHAGDLIRGRYRITEVLHRNAAGTLMEAVDEHRLDVPGVPQRIAIMLFDPDRSGDVELLRRLYRLQALSHPCILRVFDLDEQQGELFATMEWLSGLSLHQLMELNSGTGLSPAAAQIILRSLASALSYSHAHDVVHGNLTAANVIATESGEIRLRGFELCDKERMANPAGDRLAFAQLAYRLLSGLAAPDYRHGVAACRAALRHPPGITRQQWQSLRDALLGKDDPQVLTAFAGGGDIAAGRYVLPRDPAAAAPRRRTMPALVAVSAVAAVIAAIGFLVVEPQRQDAGGFPTPATTAQALPIASASAAQPVIVPSPAVLDLPEAPAPEAVAAAPAQRARIEFSTSTIEVDGDEPFATVWVRRKDNTSGPVTFQWWTETGSAELNRDFLAIEPRRESIPDGARVLELRVPLLADPSRLKPRTFYVKIDSPGARATLGKRTLAQVNILPNGHRDDTAAERTARVEQLVTSR